MVADGGWFRTRSRNAKDPPALGLGKWGSLGPGVVGFALRTAHSPRCSFPGATGRGAKDISGSESTRRLGIGRRDRALCVRDRTAVANLARQRTNFCQLGG